MKDLFKTIEENENRISATIIVNGNLVAELNFEACDITYSTDRALYISYDGTDITIPIENASIIYDGDYNTYEIDCGFMEVDVTF